MMSTPRPTHLTVAGGRPVHRVLILGGGFGGLHTAMHLERLLRGRQGVEITLVAKENFFLFTPMLHEVAASDLDITHIVSPIRALLRRTRVIVGDIASIDLDAKVVRVSHGLSLHGHDLQYDQLVIGLGSITNFYGLPGLEARALTMKSLGDAIELRNRIIATLEEADTEWGDDREGLLTFVVAGGGFAGVETVAGMNDFIREGLRFYPRIRPERIRMVLVHSGAVILPELGEKLGRYAARQLTARGVDIVTEARVAGLSESGVTLDTGARIPTRLVVWTAGTSPHPLLHGLPCQQDRGRVVTDDSLRVPGCPGVWALGDCALVPNRRTGQPHPPTAQHAIREARTVARNVVATWLGRPCEPFEFSTIGQLAAIGRRTGVARVFGINFSGFIAWWLWRTIYLSKLPRLEKKVRVAIDWTLDLMFEKDFVQFLTVRGASMSMRMADPSDARQPAAVSARTQRVDASR